MPVRMREIVREHKGLLVALFEIHNMAGVSRQRAAHMVREEWFPEPVDFMEMGTCWWRYFVEEALLKRQCLKLPPIGIDPRRLFEPAVEEELVTV